MDEHALDCIRKAGRIVGEARELGVSLVAANVPLVKVAEETEAYIYERGAKLAFPTNISINDVAAHFLRTCTTRRDSRTGTWSKWTSVRLWTAILEIPPRP